MNGEGAADRGVEIHVRVGRLWAEGFCLGGRVYGGANVVTSLGGG